MNPFILALGSIISAGFALSFFAGIFFYKLRSKPQQKDTSSRDYSGINELAAAIIERDSEGRIIFCSPYTEVLTGYSRQEILESDKEFFLTICDPAHQERIFRSLKVSSLSGEPFQFQFPFFHKSGIAMWGESRSAPLFDENQEIIGTISVTIDVTQMVLHQKLVEEKNADLKEFTSMISHDLKAPIYTINGLINIIKEDFSDELPPSADELLTTIEKSGHRLEQLIQSILEYARIGAREFENTDVPLTEVFEDVLAENHHRLEQVNVSLEIPELPTVIGDRSALTQIFSNLIGNAAKYRAPDRSLELQLKSRQGPLPRQVQIDIIDNGRGIPANRINDIFKPFVRVHQEDAAVEGSGIGLATVHKLTERLGGKVSVASTSNGSCFTVTLRTSH